MALEFVIIRGYSVVRIDERPGHVAIDRVGVIGGQLLGLLVRRRVLRYCGLLELGHEMRGCYEFDEALLRVGNNTLKVSMCASQPHFWYCERIHSAFCLS